ncbi:hypothetical protein GW869_00595 [bacterium]|uniref:DUF4145 domain-containing protein n=4 Tax=Candidatus Nealsoniibacteriota TaxID=1817911 RepID=A0A2M7EC53_9BACT|nr:hypothetical protein [bacterium]PIV65289.1 MAG: hypothetical protein COS09_00330 [Candidatus Nealsonbacteria bacterium CG01_land_8_20_14_3_00_12]PIW34681.1 MAG: hypothetical protein COW25_02575 [Candidatus Nealsonbacteria bacterium CG15_BIG_FIL_POST_REV_8_21_14_020_37_12]PIW91273.1 MAG: hypothetical protein COZ90_01340 [Candidatus Nealsonbacteria bacterium CG_4_8_14_3_um_filter_37_36]PJA83507.1 MAG: hypothetical protein CO146_01040 [Candidatus Nealsonbacteria bacterium CG_4_9_14_3_um_filter_
MTIEQIISFILNPTFSGWLLVLKILCLIFSLIFFGFIIFALIKTSWLKRMIIWDLQEFLTYRPFGVSKIAGKWQKIKKRLEAGIESEAKLAIIEADSMLDGILDRMGFGGRTLGERLDRLTDVSLPNIEEAKKSHKIRNNIVHDPTYKLDLEEAKKVISAYEKALTDLQAL